MSNSKNKIMHSRQLGEICLENVVDECIVKALKEFESNIFTKIVESKVINELLTSLSQGIYDSITPHIEKNHKYSVTNNIKLIKNIDELCSRFNDFTDRLYDIENKLSKLSNIPSLNDKILSLKTKIDTQTELINMFEKHIKETYIAQINCDIKKIEAEVSARLDILDKLHSNIPTIIGNEVGKVISNALQQLPMVYPYPTLTY